VVAGHPVCDHLAGDANATQEGPAVHLVQILLPLDDNKGRPLPRTLYAELARELTARFGGLTAYTRAPAEGLWRDEEQPEPAESGTHAPVVRDEIVIYEVMAEELDAAWWADRRRALERDFRQDTVIVRAQELRLL
jgi:hypothetical protein